MSYNLLIDGEVYGPVDKKIEIPLENGDYQDFIVPDLGPKSISLSETPEIIKASDEGLDGFNSIYIPNIPNDYIGNAITKITPEVVIPDKNGVTFSAGQYLNGELTIDPIPSEYIAPSGDINLSTNGSHDVSGYINALVNVSNLTRYTSNTINFNNDISGVQMSYDTSKVKITVGFKPKIFIFRPQSYDDGKTLGKMASNGQVLVQSVNVYDGLCTGGMGTFYTSFITKVTATSKFGSTSVSITGGELTSAVGGDLGFYLNPNNPNEVYLYMTVSDYAFRKGTWFWEAYG